MKTPVSYIVYHPALCRRRCRAAETVAHEAESRNLIIACHTCVHRQHEPNDGRMWLRLQPRCTQTYTHTQTRTSHALLAVAKQPRKLDTGRLHQKIHGGGRWVSREHSLLRAKFIFAKLNCKINDARMVEGRTYTYTHIHGNARLCGTPLGRYGTCVSVVLCGRKVFSFSITTTTTAAAAATLTCERKNTAGFAFRSGIDNCCLLAVVFWGHAHVCVFQARHDNNDTCLMIVRLLF